MNIDGATHTLYLQCLNLCLFMINEIILYWLKKVDETTKTKEYPINSCRPSQNNSHKKKQYTGEELQESIWKLHH